MCKIKYVFFDLDDTLLNFKESEKCAIKNTLIRLGISPSDEIAARYSEINRLMWKKLELAEITRDELRGERFKMLFSEISISASSNDARRIYEEELSRTCFFMPYAIDVLEFMKKRYTLYLASNGTASVQRGRISASGIEKYFKDIFISDTIGFNKPSREFFEYCFEKIPNFCKDEAIIIGDSLSSDILGGGNAGIKTCLYNPEGKPASENIVPTYEIKSLRELPQLLDTIQ